MYMKNINLPLPEDLLEQIDRNRGDVPRTVFIRKALERNLGAAEPRVVPSKPTTTSPPTSATKQAPKIVAKVKEHGLTVEEHRHAKHRVINGGWWICECNAVSPDNGKTWKGGR